MEDESRIPLDPERLGFWKSIRFLVGKNSDGRPVSMGSYGVDRLYEPTLLRRIVVVISFFLIAILQSCSILWSCLVTIYTLVFKNLRGKNGEVLNVTQLTDPRVELDPKIRHGDPRYNSSLAIMAAKIVYENPDSIERIVRETWKMEFIKFFRCKNAFEKKLMIERQHSTQAFMFSDKTGDYELICVSFRGTESIDDWCTNIDVSRCLLGEIGNVHLGFSKALGLQMKDTGGWWPKEVNEPESGEDGFAYYTIRKVLRKKLKENPDARFILTGHSLGGALAVLFTAILYLHDESELLERLEGVYTFGQPRVGDQEFCNFMDKNLGAKYFRFVYANDYVPRLPLDDYLTAFKHFGKCYYFNCFFKGQVKEEEPDVSYFSRNLNIVGYVVLYLTTKFELARSVVMPRTYGRSYKEGIVFRYLGLIFPGLPAHCNHNYVNITRSASLHALLHHHHHDE